jgi:hypothetical protein
MKKFIILVNSGLYNSSVNVFSREELEEVFDEWSGGDVMIDEDGEEVSVDDLIELGSMGEKVNIVNESMVEIGDEWVELSVVELSFREREG